MCIRDRRCIEEIKADMQSPRPMDRVLCGDVGYGKTEVALRAAFKCVLDSKQCAILVPTTILALSLIHISGEQKGRGKAHDGAEDHPVSAL